MKTIARWLLCLALVCGPALAAAGPGQGSLVSVGILTFQDESGTRASPEFLQKLSQGLRLKLTLEHQDTLGRPLSGGSAPADIEQTAALGRQQGVQFVVRGGLLAAVSSKTAGELRCRLVVYCDLIDVDNLSVSTYRAEGEGTESDPSREDALHWGSYSWDAPEFAASALGGALDAVLGELADQIYAGMSSAMHRAEPEPVGFEAPPPAGPGEGDPAEDPYQTDQELQQLIAHAESLISSEGASGLIDVASLQQALGSLLASLDAKLGLLEQARDTAAIDLQILRQQEELQGLVDACAEQLAMAHAGEDHAADPGREQTNLTSILKELLQETMNRLLDIKEIEAALGIGDEGESEEFPPADPDADEYHDDYDAAEEWTSDVSGVVVDEAGSPIEGATIFEPETGASARTDSTGAYTIPHLPGGRMAELQVIQAGKPVASGRVELRPGKTGVADWVVRSGSGGPTALFSRVLPPTTVAKSSGVRSGANVRGVVLSATGGPLSLVLVTIPGVGVVRTDPSGRYFFANVPPGNYEMILRRERSAAQTQRITVAAMKTTEHKIVYLAKSARPGGLPRGPVLARGADTLVRGRVADESGKPIERAKLTLFHPGGALAAYSDARGGYEIRNVKQGTYRLLASKPGYQSSSADVDLNNKKRALLHFKLKPASSNAVRRAVASRSEKRAPASTDSAKTSKATTATKTAPKTETTAATAKTAGTTKTTTTAATTKTTAATQAAKAPPSGDKGTVLGTVVDDKTGKAVVEASILLKGKVIARTDSSGRFRIGDLAAGSYSVIVRKNGYKEGSGSFTVKPGGTTSLRIRLSPLATIKTAPVTIRKTGR